MGYMEQKTKMDRLLLPHNIRKCINLVVDFHTVYVSPTGWHFSFSASILLTKKILVICVRHTHFTLLAFMYNHLTIIFAPSSLKSCFSTGVSGVSGASGASGVSGVSGVSGASGVSGVSSVPIFLC